MCAGAALTERIVKKNHPKVVLKSLEDVVGNRMLLRLWDCCGCEAPPYLMKARTLSFAVMR